MHVYKHINVVGFNDKLGIYSLEFGEYISQHSYTTYVAKRGWMSDFEASKWVNSLRLLICCDLILFYRKEKLDL